MRAAMALAGLLTLGSVAVFAQAPNTAIVSQDRTVLRAAARDSAQQHAMLWAGDTLEVRGKHLDYLQVYDHRRERAGFVRTSAVRVLRLDSGAAADLLAVVRFLRDAPGSESLGIGFAAAYLKAAPADAIGGELFDALGTMADRLARRASSNRNSAHTEALTAQLEVIAQYGVQIRSFDQGGRMQLCYDGEAFRRVLALAASAENKARAALALTRPECVDPDLGPLDRRNLDDWRAEVLDRVPRANLQQHLQNRVRLRTAAVWASLAFHSARRGESAQGAADRALREFAAVDPRELAEEDTAAYSDAAVRVGASRWAAETALARATGLTVETAPGQPGETCIKLVDKPVAKQPDEPAALSQRCTFGTVWTNSARTNAQGSALVLAVQPLDSWREMWVFHRTDAGWRLDILPPGTDTSDPGYIEFAGWVPGKKKMLAAREAKTEGRFTRRFEVLDLETLAVEKHADNPAYLSTFYRWQDPLWKRQTLSLR